MVSAVSVKRQSTFGYCVTALKINLRKEGKTEEEIKEAVARFRDEWDKFPGPGTVKGAKVIKQVSEATIHRKAREEFNRIRDLIQKDVERVFKEGKPGWEEELERLGKLKEAHREAWEKVLEDRRNKGPGPPAGQGGLLGNAKRLILQSPRWREGPGGPRPFRKKREPFGPSLVTPDVSDFECKVWKMCDAHYTYQVAELFSVGTSKWSKLREVWRMIAQTKRRSSYDSYMAYAIPHVLRGILPAKFPYKLKWWNWVHVFCPEGGDLPLPIPIPGWNPDHLPCAFNKPYRMHLNPFQTGEPYDHNWQVHKPYPFNPRWLYAAYVAFWSSDPPPAPDYASSLVSIQINTSCPFNSWTPHTHRINQISPTKASWMIKAYGKGGEELYLDPTERGHANESYHFHTDLYKTAVAAALWYLPGLEYPDTMKRLEENTYPVGVYDYQEYPDTFGAGDGYLLEKFDSTHSWHHWPHLMTATRYSHANPPDWWFKSQITVPGGTYYRLRPPYGYQGNPVVRGV